MDHVTIAVGLFVAITALVILARVINIPYPIALVIGGLILGFIPGLPAVTLDPNLIFLIVLPPILYTAAYLTSTREFYESLPSISLLAIALVIVTTLGVGIFAHLMIQDLSWTEAFVLGAIVSPPDAIAATAINRRLGVERRIVTILEGESLVNDASALVIYKIATIAVLTGSFSLMSAGSQFLFVCIGGILIGLACGWIFAKLLPRIKDPTICITTSIIIPYLCYLPADHLGVSGVLSVVVAGLFVGNRVHKIFPARIRLDIAAFWRVVIFILNSLVFILIGLQLPSILAELQKYPILSLISYGALVSLAVILIRLIWVFSQKFIFSFIRKKKLRKASKTIGWKNTLVMSWCGMRGVVSLAAALALPLIPERDLIIFLTFSVILSTLVLQGLTLPLIIKALGLNTKEKERVEEGLARIQAAEVALKRLDEIAKEDDAPSQFIERMRLIYKDRIIHANRLIGNELLEHEEDIHSHSFIKFKKELLNAERKALFKLHHQGIVSNDIMRRILHDLDIEATQIKE